MVKVSLIVMNFLRALVSQDRAVANARSACTYLSGRRVERDDVELFFEELEERAAAQAASVAAEPERTRDALPR